LTNERRSYSRQAIEIADYIARDRGLEYEIPEFAEKRIQPQFPWYVDYGFLLLFASVIGLDFIYLPFRAENILKLSVRQSEIYWFFTCHTKAFRLQNTHLYFWL